MVPFLDLRRQVGALRPEIDAAIAEVLDAGQFILSDAVAGFEDAFAAWCGAREAVGVASGTDAITVALMAVGVGPGDEVVTAAGTCVPTVAGIEAAGAVPVLADVEPASATLDPSALDEAITGRTRAIVPVHLYGRPADMEGIMAVAARHGIRVVEDAAHAHGAAVGGRRAGTLADAAAFSFYPTKNLGALGDGGAVVTDDPAIADRARLIRTHGSGPLGLSETRGVTSRLDSLQAAVLAVKLRHLDRWSRRRREIAAVYHAELGASGLVLPGEAPGQRHAYHLFAVRTPRRDELRAALASAGVQTLVHYSPAIHEHPAYRHLDRPGHLVESERLAAETLSLPLYPELSDEELQAVCAAAAGALRWAEAPAAR